jgi:hypothetical protein
MECMPKSADIIGMWNLAKSSRRNMNASRHTHPTLQPNGIPMGSQRDVVYLGWPIAPSYMSPIRGMGVGVVGSQPMSTDVQCAHGAQRNFVDLTPYLTYGYTVYIIWANQETEDNIVQPIRVLGDVVYLGWPIAPSYMSPNAGGGGGGRFRASQPMSTAVHMEPK